MALPQLLRTLLTTPGPSGNETRVAAIWREAAGAFAEVTTDAMGSSFARVRGRGEGPTVTLLGHVDEIGFALTHVDEQGLASFSVIGGYNPEVLVAQRVLIAGRGGPVPGVIGRRRIPPEKIGDRDAVRVEDLHVDLGARTAEEARALVAIGDVGVVLGEPTELANGRFASRAMDNRIGAYVVLEVARRIAEAGGAAGDVVAVASVQEELGLLGARAVAYGLQPDVAFAVDITPASDQPGGDPRASGKVGLGDGPAIDTAPILHPTLKRLLVETAESEGIPICFEVSTRGTHTDADELHLSGAGIPTALVSVPLRYTHSPIETAQLSDVEDTIRLLVAAIGRLDAGVELAR